jgi:hypothetical protein
MHMPSREPWTHLAAIAGDEAQHIAADLGAETPA